MMIDPNIPVRTCYFQLLNGNISVPVYSDFQYLEDSPTINTYVIIGDMFAADNSPLSDWAYKMSVNLQICTKATGRSAKYTLDQVAAEIMGLLLPDRTGPNGLPFDPQFQILNVVLESSRYLDPFQGKALQVSRRILTFIQDVIQK